MPREMLDAGPEPPNFECQHLHPGPFRARPRFKRPLQTKSRASPAAPFSLSYVPGQKAELEVAPRGACAEGKAEVAPSLAMSSICDWHRAGDNEGARRHSIRLRRLTLIIVNRLKDLEPFSGAL